MSREGFAVMDVAASIANDPKFRRIHRGEPAHVAPAFMAYMAVVGESWTAGQRVTIEDAWPTLLPYDTAVVKSMIGAGLLDKRGRIDAKAWATWFGPAQERRDTSRARWRDYNEKRKSRTNNDAQHTELPRGNHVDTTTSVRPSVPSVPSVPTEPSVRPSGDDPADAYWQLTGKYPSGKLLTWIDESTERYGSAAVIRGLTTAFTEDNNPATLMGRAQDHWRREARELDRQEKEAEHIRLAEKRAIPKILEPWREEYRKALLDGAA